MERIWYCYDCANSGTNYPGCAPAVNPYEWSGFALPTEAGGSMRTKWYRV